MLPSMPCMCCEGVEPGCAHAFVGKQLPYTCHGGATHRAQRKFSEHKKLVVGSDPTNLNTDRVVNKVGDLCRRLALPSSSYICICEGACDAYASLITMHKKYFV